MSKTSLTVLEVLNLTPASVRDIVEKARKKDPACSYYETDLPIPRELRGAFALYENFHIRKEVTAALERDRSIRDAQVSFPIRWLGVIDHVHVVLHLHTRSQ